jgi:Zn-dependent protease
LIFYYSELIGENNLLFLTVMASALVALLAGIGFHEACHAYMANSLGDSTPARQGRVTLNPISHLDPAGTIMMLIVGFGWGKPVQFNPNGLKADPRTAMLLVSAAGPLSNFVLATALAFPIRMGWYPFTHPFSNLDRINSFDEYVGLFLTATVVFNIGLGVFNLVPIHPLDGFKVVLGLLPEQFVRDWARLAEYGPGLLMLLIAMPFVTSYFGKPISPLRDIIGPVSIRILRAVTGID